MIEDDVRARVQARSDALAARDQTALLALHHPQLRWTTYRGDVLDRAAYVAQNTGAGLTAHAQEHEDLRVVAVGDVAVVTSVVTDTVERDGERATHRVRLTQTWVRESSAWRLLAGHAGPPVG